MHVMRNIMSLTVVAPGHEDTVEPTVWFIHPIFSAKERENSTFNDIVFCSIH